MLALESRQDVTLIQVVGQAFRWRRMPEAGGSATINRVAASEKINASCVSRVPRLTRLAPVILQAALDDRQAEGITLTGLMEPFPLERERQQARLRGMAARTIDSIAIVPLPAWREVCHGC